jgi:O-antigen/teichoic acid export membrane protein
MEGKIKNDFAQVLAGNVLYYACQWSIVVALAKLGTPEQLGEYALGMAIAAPILLFANLQLRAVIASDVKDQFTFEQYFTFRMASLLLALVVIAAAGAGAATNWRQCSVILLVAFAQAVDYFAETYYGWMQKHGRLDRMARSLAMKGPLALLALCVAMDFTHNVLWAVLGLAAGRLAILLAWDSRLRFATAPSMRLDLDFFRLRHRSPLFGLLRLAAPLGVISMLGSLGANIPRYFVEAHLGSAELGIFSAIASLLSAGTLVVSAFGQSAFLPVAEACARADRAAFRTYLTAAVAVGALLGCAGIAAAGVFGRQILAHLFRPEYALRQDVFIRLMVAGTVTFAASGAGFVVTAARSLNPQIPVLVVAAAVCMAVSAWSVPKTGLDGAANAVLASAVVQLAGTALIAWQVDRRLGAPQSIPAGKLAEVETA